MDIKQLLTLKLENSELYCDTTPEALEFFSNVFEEIDEELVSSHHIGEGKLKYYSGLRHIVRDGKLVGELAIIDIDTDKAVKTFETDRFEYWSNMIEEDGSYYISNDGLTDFENSCWIVLSEIFGEIAFFSHYFEYFIYPNGEIEHLTDDEDL